MEFGIIVLFDIEGKKKASKLVLLEYGENLFFFYLPDAIFTDLRIVLPQRSTSVGLYSTPFLRGESLPM